MTYIITLVMFFSGFVVGRSLENKGPLFSRICPRAAPWAEMLYGIRVAAIAQLLFCLFVSWNPELATVSVLALLSMLRGTIFGPQLVTETELINLTRVRALSGVCVYGGFLVVGLLV